MKDLNISMPDFDELFHICLNIEFPGTNKGPKDHPIGECYISNKMSPKKAGKDKDMIEKAVKNLRGVGEKGLNEGKYLEYFVRGNQKISSSKEEAARVVLDRFTIAKIAPKVTALSKTSFIKILKFSGKDYSKGIYCPMAGFGGIVRAVQSLNIPVEAYDINQKLNKWYGGHYRDVLAQTIETDKVVAVCPPFGRNTERGVGTPDDMYYSFEEGCDLIKLYIKAPDYIFIGPEKKSKNNCGLFGKSIGVQFYNI